MDLYLLLGAAAGICALGYLVVIFNSVPGAVEERFGELEQPPELLGQWRVGVDADDAEAAAPDGRTDLQRQTRTLEQPGGLFGGGYWVHQSRWVDQGGRVIAVGRERRVRRKRLKSGTRG